MRKHVFFLVSYWIVNLCVGLNIIQTRQAFVHIVLLINACLIITRDCSQPIEYIVPDSNEQIAERENQANQYVT